MEGKNKKIQRNKEKVSEIKIRRQKALNNNFKLRKNIKLENKKDKIDPKKNDNIKLFVGIVLLFIFAFLILYRESILDSKVKNINKVKEEIKKIEKENSQIELGFQSKVSLNNIEKQAETRLGMKKQSKDNTVYIKLDVEDFIDPVVITKIEEEDNSFLKKISDFLLDLIDKKNSNGEGIKITDEKKDESKEAEKKQNKE